MRSRLHIFLYLLIGGVCLITTTLLLIINLSGNDMETQMSRDQYYRSVIMYTGQERFGKEQEHKVCDTASNSTSTQQSPESEEFQTWMVIGTNSVVVHFVNIILTHTSPKTRVIVISQVSPSLDLRVRGKWRNIDRMKALGAQIAHVELCDDQSVQSLFSSHHPSHVVWFDDGCDPRNYVQPHSYATVANHSAIECTAILFAKLTHLAPIHTTLLLVQSVHAPRPPCQRMTTTLARHWLSTHDARSLRVLNFVGALDTFSAFSERFRTLLVEETTRKSELPVHANPRDLLKQKVYTALQSLGQADSQQLEFQFAIETAQTIIDQNYHAHLRCMETFLELPKAIVASKAVEEYIFKQFDFKICHTNNDYDRRTWQKVVQWSLCTAWEESTVNHDVNVVMSTYFTSSRDPQRPEQEKLPGNRYSYLSDWYESLTANNMHSVIFHDHLRPSLLSKLAAAGGLLDSVFVESLHSRSTNDIRFYLFLEYLLQHPEIDRALLTDISDVTFQRDPFELMKVLESASNDNHDRIFVGTDIPFFPNMQSIGWLQARLALCFPANTLDPDELEAVQLLQTVYNAGCIGGHRSVLLPFLQMMVRLLERTPPHVNCNMAVLNYVLHRHFERHIFTGFPLSSIFMQHQRSPRGVYIVHK